MSISLEEANKRINEISNEVQATVEKGWVCGETRMPLSEDHQKRLVEGAQAKVDKIQEEYIGSEKK